MTKRKIAEEIHLLYNASIDLSRPQCKPTKPPKKLICKKCDLAFFTNSPQALCDRCRGIKKYKARTLDDLDAPSRRAFLRAARDCIEFGYDPREYIVAQFAKWREASAYHKKLLWPMPHHLGTLAARVRYLQHKAVEEIRRSRVPEVEEQDDKRRWYVEERTLKSLAMIHRLDPIEVLTTKPEEFSRAFLERHDVWGVVSELWEERQQV